MAGAFLVLCLSQNEASESIFVTASLRDSGVTPLLFDAVVVVVFVVVSGGCFQVL